MKIKVLGSAAGGGFPQWNCACPNCGALRGGTLKGLPRTQAQVAVSSGQSSWFLLNASPDLRQQILATPELAPSPSTSGSPVSSILLTSADVDCVMGLLHLREFQPLHIYSTLSVRRILTEENSLFRVLARSNPPARWDSLPLDRLFPLAPPSGSRRRLPALHGRKRSRSRRRYILERRRTHFRQTRPQDRAGNGPPSALWQQRSSSTPLPARKNPPRAHPSEQYESRLK